VEKALHIVLTKRMVFLVADTSEDFEPVLESDFVAASLVK